ncbi:MAG: hypothetical protein ACYSWU_14080, partial [Planctomycetota bacterium]
MRTVNSTEIMRALQLLHAADGALIELRVIASNGKICGGFYRDKAKLAADAAAVNSSGSMYITLNAIRADLGLYQRAPDQLLSSQPVATRDKDIIWRQWLLIDCDPVRPRGAGKMSATDAEKDASLQTARQVRQYLVEEQGWPEPLMCDSGNGYHLLFPLGGIESTPAIKQLIKRLLSVLAKRFNNSQVTIDRTVFNAARITKLYGTLAVKDPHTPDRPHRLSSVEYVPEQLIPVTVGQIEAVAGANPEPVKQVTPRTSSTVAWDIDSLLAEHSIVARKDDNYVL